MAKLLDLVESHPDVIVSIRAAAFGLPFCIINRIENVLLSIGAIIYVMSVFLVFCTALQTCLKQCNTLW